MPLSKDEQRRFDEIEQALREDDPLFAATVTFDRLRRRRLIIRCTAPATDLTGKEHGMLYAPAVCENCCAVFASTEVIAKATVNPQATAGRPDHAPDAATAAPSLGGCSGSTPSRQARCNKPPQTNCTH